jgi:ABC-type dipeptide/oligopeptide/nickel transport system permease component
VLTYVIRRLLYGSAVLFAASMLVFWVLSLVTTPIGFLRMQPILSSGVVTETIFVAFLMVTAVFVVTFNLLADLAYGCLDPRIRRG